MTQANWRKAHPYHMYDAIQAQPSAVAEVLGRNAAPLDAAAELFGRQRTLYVCGIGTSFHASLVGEYLMRLIAADAPPTRAAHSFEFVRYPPPIPPQTGVLVFSHRGTKNYSLQALERANREGAATVTIAGQGAGEGIHKAQVTLITVPQEISAAHTISYATAMTLMAALTLRLARHTGKDIAEVEMRLAQLPELMQRALQSESQIQSLAQTLKDKEFIAFVGGGPNTATAYEVALKMKETNYSPCEGFEVEQFLHGPMAMQSERMAVWVIAPPGPSHGRCLDIVRAMNAVGATTIALAQDDEQMIAAQATHTIKLPAIHEALSPLLYVIPLQLFSYHLALVKGTNPDTFHRDHPRHEGARQFYTL